MTRSPLVVALCVALLAAAPAQAARPVREAQGDQAFAIDNFKLARALYREALRGDPHSDRLWAKYDLAFLREMAMDARPVTVVSAAPAEPMSGPTIELKHDHAHSLLSAQLRAARLSPPLGAPTVPGTITTPRRDQPLEPALDRGGPADSVVNAPLPLPSVPGQKTEVEEDTVPTTGGRSQVALATDAARAQGLEPEGTPPAQLTPVPPPLNTASNVTTLAPNESISVPQVQPGDNFVASVGPRGEPLVVKGVGYDVWDLRFGVDNAGRPHVLGRLRNLDAVNLVNPAVYVALLDPASVQVAFKPVKLADPSGVLFPGASGEFDAEFPNLHNVIAGYRLYAIRH